MYVYVYNSLHIIIYYILHYYNNKVLFTNIINNTRLFVINIIFIYNSYINLNNLNITNR